MLPLLLIMVLGTIDLGRLYFAYVSVTNAARNGAQYGSFNFVAADDTTGIRDAAVKDTQNLVDTSATNPDVVIEPCEGGDFDNQGMQCVRVHVDYTFNTLIPWPGLPNSIDMGRSVQMRVAELPE